MYRGRAVLTKDKVLSHKRVLPAMIIPHNCQSGLEHFEVKIESSVSTSLLSYT